MNMKRSELRATVIMSRTVVNKLGEHMSDEPFKEWIVAIIGSVAIDKVKGKPIIYIHDIYQEIDEMGTDSTCVFSPEYQMRAFKYVRKTYPDYHIIGNCHSHGTYPEFFSDVDYDMMHQQRDECVYMVVSPKTKGYKLLFKDYDFNLYECDLLISNDEESNHLFDKSVTSAEFPVEESPSKNGITFQTKRNYTGIERLELEKRFHYSIDRLAGKKVLIVGAGTIGGLMALFLVKSAVRDITIVDCDLTQYWNLPRTFLPESSCGKNKAIEVAKMAALSSPFSCQVTGINANIYNLGYGFLKDFDLVFSPVDSQAVRHYIDRGAKIYNIPHITCGTGTGTTGKMCGNIVDLTNNRVDLDYVWGTGYKKDLEKRKSCSDYQEETQPQVIPFSAEIAGKTVQLGINYLLERNPELVTTQYIVNEVGYGINSDKASLKVFKYGRMPSVCESELFGVLDHAALMKVTFNRKEPKHKLWEMLREICKEDIISYALDLEWSLNVPIAYVSTGAIPKIEVMAESGVDETLMRLPRQHVYKVIGEKQSFLIEITFVDD